MTEARLHALVAQWRRTAVIDEEAARQFKGATDTTFKLFAARFAARAAERRHCADALEAALADGARRPTRSTQSRSRVVKHE